MIQKRFLKIAFLLILPLALLSPKVPVSASDEVITVDGNSSEWSGVPVYAESTASETMKITSNSDTIFFMVEGPIQSSMTQILIDSDNNTLTGLQTAPLADWSISGFDMMFQTYVVNNVRMTYLYKYSSGQFIKMSNITNANLKVSLSNDSKTMEVSIPTSLLIGATPDTESLRFAYKNMNPTGGSPSRLPKRGEASIRYLYNPSHNMSPQNFVDHFDSLSDDYWFHEVPIGGKSDSIVPGKGVNGGSCLRLQVNDTDEWVLDGNRSELVLGSAEQLHMYEYEFYTYLPTNDPSPYGFKNDNGGEIITQWHNVPDPDEKWTSPPLALRTAYGYYYLDRLTDAGEMSDDTTMKVPTDAIKNGPMTGSTPLSSTTPLSYESDRGKWVHWRFVIRWDWRPVADGGKGLIEVYKDETLVKSVSGPNTTNDLYGPTFKIGIYKFFAKPNNDHNGYLKDSDGSYVEPWSNVKSRVILYDEVKVREIR
jgi:hypothetical protein